MTLNCPSTTVDSDSAETSGKGRKSTINKNYECVVRLARRTAVTRFKHQVGSIPTTLTKEVVGYFWGFFFPFVISPHHLELIAEKT